VADGYAQRDEHVSRKDAGNRGRLDHMAETRPPVAGFTVQRPQDVPASTFDAIVLSTSRFQVPMRKRLRAVYKRPTMIDLFDGLPANGSRPSLGMTTWRQSESGARPPPRKPPQKIAAHCSTSQKSTAERHARPDRRIISTASSDAARTSMARVNRRARSMVRWNW
jgi:hypothetical protein